MQTLRERKTDLSVIIPVYNLEKFIQPMLDSLREQQTGNYNIEIIFVLNNCTDHSEDIIRASRLPCIIEYCTTQGCGPARNTGLDKCTGEYIWFMDGDDWLISETAIRSALDRIKRDNLDILRIPFVSNMFRYNYFSMVWQYVIRKDFLDGLRFPNYQPCEDDAFMIQALAMDGYDNHTFINMPALEEPMYYYNYLREGSNMFRHMRGEQI